MPDGESPKELPKFLKQKLRARGILKDEPEKNILVSFDDLFLSYQSLFSFTPV